jgi:phosphatidylglycerophosphate synthase
MTNQYHYRASVKSHLSDELINTYVLRPLAGLLVRLLFNTRVTPNQVTVGAIIAGIIAAAFYALGTRDAIAAGGLLVTLKDLLDSADGQLARAKSLYSRNGRFLDSIGDVVVNFFVFSAIGLTLSRATGDWMPILFSGLGFAGMTLRVSYHVFYQASYLHLEGKYEKNRLIEEITDEDRQGDKTTLQLQTIFMGIYGWQDRMILRVDHWCRRGRLDEDFRQRWYSDLIGLRLTGLLGFGTELFLLTVCSLLNRLELYLLLNIGLMNFLLILSIMYRRWRLAVRITSSGGIS